MIPFPSRPLGYRSFVSRVFAACLALLLCLALTAPAGAEGTNVPYKGWKWGDHFFVHDITSACTGECGFHIYGGAFVDTTMKSTVGLEPFVPIWEWEYLNSGIVAAALSRPVLTWRNLAEVEGEVGIAKRFGDLKSPEIWAALFFRWKWFPWNKYVKTSISVSTGFSYAFKNDRIEAIRTDNGGRGSKLLHFLTPEIAFSLPDYPDYELVFRFHHRSGGKEFLLGDTEIFNGASGGAQYATVGVRFRF